MFAIQDSAAASGDARIALVRMAESASAVTTYTDPFPTVALVANASCNWMKSNTASATTRDYHCVVWETGIVLAIKVSGTIDVWEVFTAGKCFSKYNSTDDPYPWHMRVRNSSNAATVSVLGSEATSSLPTTAQGKTWLMRNAQGTIKSEAGVMSGPGSSIGVCTNCQSAGGGYLNTVDYAKLPIIANGASSTTTGGNPILNRLCIPQIYQGLHSGYGGVGEGDNINNGSHTLILLRASASIACVLETSNLFSGYPAG